MRWGVTWSSIQAEGVHPAADWSRWEQEKRVPASSDGSGLAMDFRDDLALIASLGCTDVRIGVEWARIEPLEGKVDAEALDRYTDMLAHARSVGLAPWVTLANTSLPGWFSEDGDSFMTDHGRGYHWLRQVDRCAERFGDLVEGWTPIDDPIGWALRGHYLGSRPPGRRGDSPVAIGEALAAVEGALIADHQAARHLRAGGATTMCVRGTPTLFAVPDDPASTLEADAAQSHVRWWASLLFDAWITQIDNGELVVGGRSPLHDQAWVDDFSLVGLAFDHPVGLGPTGGFAPWPPDAPRSDSGFVPLPEELGVLVHRVSERLPDHDLVIAANGLATTNDGWRSEVLAETLDIVDELRSDGLKLQGYFHDTAIDGYEWRAGYSTQRGIIDRDRTRKDSAELYADRIAAARGT